MADALVDVGVIRMAYPIVAGKTDKFTGLHVATGQSVRVFMDSGTLVFTAFVLEEDATTGTLTKKVVSTDSAGVSWTDLYLAATGKSAYIILITTNIGATAGTYSFGIAGATEVVGESAGA